MRPLTLNEIEAISGGESISFQLPAGARMTSTLQANNSTTLNFTFANGYSVSWNSGIAVSCFVMGAGTAALVTGFTAGNAALGTLIGVLASHACSYSVSSEGGGAVDPADGDGGY